MKALLVIDVQEALFQKRTKVYHEAQLLANIKLLIDRAAEAGAEIVLSRHTNDSSLRRGSPAWEIHHEIVPPPDCIIVDKLHASCFRETSLDSRLEELGVSEVVVSGLVTQGCIRASCLDALARGYAVTLVADAHSSYHRGAATLVEVWNEKLRGAGAIIQETGRVTFR